MSHLKILSAGSTLHGLRACAPLAAQSLGLEIELATDHGHNIRDAVRRGDAKADVVLLPANMIAALGDRLRDAVPLGTVGIGGAVRTGARAPDISTMEKLRGALVLADAVLLTTAPTGEHLLDVVALLGLRDTVSAKLTRYDTSTKLNLALAARSDHAIGFGPETEIRAGEGVQWIGDVPDKVQIALPYAAAMLATSAHAGAARHFLDFLRTGAAREAFAKSGVRS
jgi:molybdate transport system substrate-binding protein